MMDDSRARRSHASPKLWATLTLMGAISTGGAIAIGGAEAARNTATQTKGQCRSKNACLEVRNARQGPGIEGSSFEGPGLMGNSNLGPAVYANGDYGYGVYAYGANNYAVFADGDVQVTGLIYTGGQCQNGCSKTRQEVSFASRSSRPTIDDVGEATLRNGTAYVALAADFANAIDTRKPYLVLLTPEGDASIYVANRTASGFEVRQIGGGHSSIPFAYRIVAKPYAVKDERLPFKTVKDYSANAARR